MSNKREDFKREIRQGTLEYCPVIIIFVLILLQNILKNPQKQKPNLTEGPLFINLKSFTFRTFSEISRFYVGFTDIDGVTAWARNTALH